MQGASHLEIILPFHL